MSLNDRVVLFYLLIFIVVASVLCCFAVWGFDRLSQATCTNFGSRTGYSIEYSRPYCWVVVCEGVKIDSVDFNKYIKLALQSCEEKK